MMKRSCVVLFAFVVIVIVLAIALISQVLKPVSDGASNSSKSRSSFSLQISSRDYAVGVSGYFPANFPNPSNADAQAFFPLIKQSAEVYGIHTNIDEMNIVDVSANQLPGMTLELVTAAKDDIWPSDVNSFIDKISTYLTKYPQIKYVGIGNEVNFHFDVGTAKYNDYFNTYKQIYAQLKQKFPDRTFFATFQYETLIGKGAITGRPGKSEWEMFTQLEPYMDAVGLTLYPGMDYSKAEDIPNDYLAQLRTYSRKSLIITETGWHTQPNFINTAFDGTELLEAETRQVNYLKKLVQLLDAENVELVNWFSLHDVAKWPSPSGQQFFHSFGLRRNDGSVKPSWETWLELKSID